MSSSSASQAQKSKLLEQLRFRKQKEKSAASTSSSSTSGLADNGQRQRRYLDQPSQVRDASQTVSSRFFAPTTPPYGKVLVPNSSPEPGDVQHNTQLGYRNSAPSPALSTHASIHGGSPWAPARSTFGVDPLSASTAFTSSNSTTNLNGRRARPAETPANHAEGPPRKKQYRGPSHDALPEIVDIPSSPEVQRAAPRRRPPPANESMDLFVSEDDSLPDVHSMAAGSSKSRLSRDRPTQSSPVLSVASTPSNDPNFAFFKMTYPGDSDYRVRSAWIVSGGDKVKAAALLADSTWVPPKPQSNGGNRETGRVKEIEEASKTQRLSAREIGKKSLIYANRPVLEANTSTPPVSKATPEISIASPASPATPFVPRPGKLKRTKKLVLHSESEHEATDSEEEREIKKTRTDSSFESRALNYFNTRDTAALQELTGCTAEQADVIIEKRPFESKEDFAVRLGQGKKKAGPGGISPRIFDDVVEIFRGYGSVDSILEDCERIGTSLRSAIASWTVTKDKAPSTSAMPGEEAEDGALSLRTLIKGDKKSKNFLTKQPAILPDGIQLKDYQLLGVNWLNLLYRRGYSCILADEMGLGKTIQVISFLAHLKEQGSKGPHLIVVPSSTLENWCREFARFAPGIRIQTYYAGKEERVSLRATLLDTVSGKIKNSRFGGGAKEGWEVLITTYNLAQGDNHDKKFFKKVDWDCTIFDEGHVLKNFQSQRYQSLLRVECRWRLLLTGTPLQNNLQELVSLMNFILPDQFTGQFTSLQAIFKAKGDANVSLLSQERISRAKKMMTPFVLRRRKDQVLKDLPIKTERIEWCEMTELQQSIYHDALQRSRKTILDDPGTPDIGTPNSTGKPAPKKKVRSKDKQYVENSSNVLMDLRKAASHPMLFRTSFSNTDLSGISRSLIKEPEFKKRGALFDIVKEDLTVMTDAELQLYCTTYRSTRKFLKDHDVYINSGKVQTLLKLIAQYRKEDRKMLIFSQFTQILDILKVILKHKGIKYSILTGSTPVDARQTYVDEFTEDESIPVFLLSTKAGGMGINLTAASVVIMFDQDFNPHNDKQAHDRAYRIGQKRDVEVVKLISRGTIEEDMLKLGETKLALDSAVAGDPEEANGNEESAPEKEVKTSLMKVLRRQLEKEEEEKGVEKPTVDA